MNSLNFHRNRAQLELFSFTGQDLSDFFLTSRGNAQFDQTQVGIQSGHEGDPFICF